MCGIYWESILKGIIDPFPCVAASNARLCADLDPEQSYGPVTPDLLRN